MYLQATFGATLTDFWLKWKYADICPDLFNSSQVCDANPTSSTAELYAILLKQWDTISVEDKNHYTELHSDAFNKYLLKVRAPTNWVMPFHVYD